MPGARRRRFGGAAEATESADDSLNPLLRVHDGDEETGEEALEGRGNSASTSVLLLSTDDAASTEGAQQQQQQGLDGAPAASKAAAGDHQVMSLEVDPPTVHRPMSQTAAATSSAPVSALASRDSRRFPPSESSGSLESVRPSTITDLDDDDISSNLPPEIRCPVCLDAFTAPVTFHCNHNVCRHHILDLAAAAEGSNSHAGVDLRVPCPKCRKETVFPNAGLGGLGEASIAVNHEMQAIVDMMIKMLQQQLQRQRQSNIAPAAAVAVSPPRPGSEKGERFRRPDSSGLPPLSGGGNRSGSRERRQVSFKGEESGGDAVLVLPSAVQQQEKAAAAAASASEQRAIGKLAQLEKDLQRRREEQRLERERQGKQKADEYKKQRQSWIDEKNRELWQQQQQQQAQEDSWAMQDHSSSGNDPHGLPEDGAYRNVSPTTLAAGSPMRPVSSRKEALVRMQQLDKAHYSQERRHEQDVHHTVQAFLNVDGSESPPPSSAGGGGGAFGRLGGGGGLSSSAMAREAESRVMPGYRAPTEEEYRAKKEQARRQRELEEEEARRNAAYVDDEVERRLWEVEQQVLREHEADLTRSQMAEIAELRARQTLVKYGKAPPSRSPPKTGYIPKMNRLQKI